MHIDGPAKETKREREVREILRKLNEPKPKVRLVKQEKVNAEKNPDHLTRADFVTWGVVILLFLVMIAAASVSP